MIDTRSPFYRHRELLLTGTYGVAESLQQFVLSLYNGARTQFAANKLVNYDDEHFTIFADFAAYYRKHAENDEAFMAVCREMWAQRERWGQEHLARVELHMGIDPKHYDEGESEWHAQRRWLDSETERMREKGWID